MTGEITVRGVVCRGHRVASGVSEASPYPAGTIALQRPHFEALGLDLSGLHPATLNVSIRPHRFRLVRPAYSFRDVHWTEAHPPEHFSFCRCRILFEKKTWEALIYYPHPETKQRHFSDDQTLEVLAPYLEGIGYGSLVHLIVDPNEVDIHLNG